MHEYGELEIVCPLTDALGTKIFTGKQHIWPRKATGICCKVRIRVMVEFIFGIVGEKMLCPIIIFLFAGTTSSAWKTINEIHLQNLIHTLQLHLGCSIEDWRFSLVSHVCGWFLVLCPYMVSWLARESSYLHWTELGLFSLLLTASSNNIEQT